jgi:hypothetical protein
VCIASIVLFALHFNNYFRPQLFPTNGSNPARGHALSTSTLSVSIMPRVRGSAVANGKADGPSLPAKGKDKSQENANTALGDEVKASPAVAEKTKPSDEDAKDTLEAGQAGEPKQKKSKTTGREGANIYWEGLAKEASLPADTVKKVLSAVKRVALRDLLHEDTKAFKIYGICELKMKQLPGRPAQVRRLPNGTEISVAKKDAHNKIAARPLKELTQGLID